MTRVIKFRAWDGEQMCTPVELQTLVQGRPLEDFGKYIWQQFTGLLDKNDKEIYEGDIVRSGSRVTDVHWLDSCGQFEHGGWEFCSHPASVLEVIGNIWENPELLK